MISTKQASQLAVWPGLAPGETTAVPGIQYDYLDNIESITGVTSPQLYVTSGPRDNCPAVVICPGGGYGILSCDLEGTEIADWLQDIGFATAVLHYRVPNRQGAFQDAQRAMSLLRSRAAEFGIDRDRIGVIGFSAGAHLSARLSTNRSYRSYAPIDEVDNRRCDPDFAVLVYPAYLVDEHGEPSADVDPKGPIPPMFIMQSEDDNRFCARPYANALIARGHEVRTEIYTTGGHGYGLRLSADVPAAQWSIDAARWLRHFL